MNVSPKNFKIVIELAFNFYSFYFGIQYDEKKNRFPPQRSKNTKFKSAARAF